MLIVKKQLIALLLLTAMLSSPAIAWEKDRDVRALEEKYHYIRIEGGNAIENIKFYNMLNSDYDGDIRLWICSTQCTIEINGLKYVKKTNNNIAVFNLSDYGYKIGAKDEMSINISYKFSGKFKKEIIYPVDEMKIEVFGDEFVRGNVPLKYSDGVYSSDFKPLKGDYIWIEFEEHKEQNMDNLIFGFTAIFAGLVILMFVIIKRKQ